jgi:glutathione synthase
MKIAMFVNDVEREIAEYATTRLSMCAASRDHEVWYIGAGDLAYAADERISARGRRVPQGKRSAKAFVEELKGTDPESLDVESLDVLFLRSDPAQDMTDRPWAQSTAVIFGQIAASRGVLVVNDPLGLSRALNKLYFQQLPRKLRPIPLVTREEQAVRDFIDEHEGYAVLKPLQGSGGQGVFLVRPEDGPNLAQMIEAVSRDGYVVAQEYLPAASDGDVRMFLLNGVPLEHEGEYAAFRRVGSGEDMRSHMHAGGTAELAKVDEAMLAIADACRPRFIQDGMFFVGIDVVGDKLVEVNLDSPGGLHSLHELTGVDFAVPIIGALERKMIYRDENPSCLSNTELAVL